MDVSRDIASMIEEFVSERNWDPFHNPKDLAIALSVEASELLELFLWKRAEEADEEKIRQELADVMIYALMLARKLDLDPEEIIREKMRINGEKYPVEKAYGRSDKYSDL